MSNFTFDYIKILTAAIGKDLRDNHDIDRFGPERTGAFGIKECLKENLAKLGLVSAGTARQTVDTGLCFVEPYLADLEWLFGKLADEESRRWLASLMAFRVLGHRKIRLATNTPDYWEGVRKAKALAVSDETIDLGFLGFAATKLSLSPVGYPIELFFVPFAVHIQFVMEPYRCVVGRTVIEARPGDFVLDCGGCYGDTALYFSHKVGPQGKVLSFEFVPTNLDMWRKNVDLNPNLKTSIRLVEAPVSDKSGQELFLEGSGPGTRIVPKPSSVGAASVRTVAIDDVVEREKLKRVDFVKMDIEGSELAALQGAEKTLRKFRPTLAVSVYHNLSDFWTIARYLDSLGLGYRFYLRHFTIHAEETVLFAVADEREQPVSEASLRAS